MYFCFKHSPAFSFFPFQFFVIPFPSLRCSQVLGFLGVFALSFFLFVMVAFQRLNAVMTEWCQASTCAWRHWVDVELVTDVLMDVLFLRQLKLLTSPVTSSTCGAFSKIPTHWNWCDASIGAAKCCDETTSDEKTRKFCSAVSHPHHRPEASAVSPVSGPDSKSFGLSHQWIAGRFSQKMAGIHGWKTNQTINFSQWWLSWAKKHRVFNFDKEWLRVTNSFSWAFSLKWLFLNTDTGLGSVHRLFVSLHLEKKVTKLKVVFRCDTSGSFKVTGWGQCLSLAQGVFSFSQWHVPKFRAKKKDS